MAARSTPWDGWSSLGRHWGAERSGQTAVDYLGILVVMAHEWSLRDCEQCGRAFNGCGPQSYCRKRDCQNMGEAPADTQRRLGNEELDRLIKEQTQDIEADRRGKLHHRSKRGRSVAGSLTLDGIYAERPHAQDVSWYDVRSGLPNQPYLGAPPHLIEWLDPTFDAVAPDVDALLANRDILRRYA